jgi:hypothetical protein
MPTRDTLLAPSPSSASILLLTQSSDHRHPVSARRQALRGRISGPETGLQQPVSVAYDPKKDEILVADAGASKILIFPGSAVGNQKPTRTIAIDFKASAIGIRSAEGVIQVLGTDADGRMTYKEVPRDPESLQLALKEGA